MKPKNREAAPPFPSWRGIPKELPTVLYQISFNARVIALELYRHSPSYDGRIEITGKWDVALCRLMGVDSVARANVCRVFKKLVEVGALRVFDGFVVVWVGQSLDGLPTQTPVATQQPEGGHSIATEGPLNSRRGATQGPLDSRPQSSNCNHTVHDRQIDRQIERERERTRARESSARFEKPPIPPAPPELPPAEQQREPWLRVWELYAEHIGLDVFQLAGAGTQERALRAIAASSEVEAGGSQGVAFENAVRRLLGAWSADKWVKEKRPSIANLALNLHRYAAPKQKPIVKLAPQPADSLMEHWSRIDAMRREEQRREDELNEIRCREALAEYEALDRAGGQS